MIEYLLELLDVEFSPDYFKLYQNYPNPFNPITTISFDVSVSTDVNLSIYDIKGNLIEDFNIGYLSPGLYSHKINASNLTSGMYIYAIHTSEGYSDKKQMILIK